MLVKSTELNISRCRFLAINVALSANLCRRYDPEFDEDVELAWRLKMAPGIDYMSFQYDK